MVRLVVMLFFESKMWRAFQFFKNVNAAFSRMKLNETRRLLGAISLTSFELVCERNFFYSIFETSDAPLNVITIFVVSCRTITVIIYTINFVFELILNYISNYF